VEPITYRASTRFWNKVTILTPEDCWTWNGSRRGDGYGQVYINGKHRAAHRLAFFLANYYYPPVVRHKCDNRTCVNPHHLEGGTQTENMRDVLERGRHYYANKTHCPQGHEYTDDNTYRRPNGSRECRACRKARKAKQDLGMPTMQHNNHIVCYTVTTPNPCLS